VATIAGNDLGNAPSTVTATDGTTGTVSVSGTTVTYTPDADFFVGSDSFTYTITDAQGDEATGTISVNLPNATPTAGDFALDTEEGVDVDGDILPNISPGNGELGDHTLDITMQPDNGTVTITGTTVTYTPDPDFSGTDMVEYRITDADGDEDTGTVTITVTDSGIEITLPGGSSAVDPWSLALLGGLPLLRRRRRRR